MPTKVHESTSEAPVAAPAGVNGQEQHPRLLTRADILAAQDMRSEAVAVPEWGGAVLVRGLSGRARDSLEGRFSDERGRTDRSKMGDFRAAFVAQTAIDEEGALLFSEADIKALGEKSSIALQRVFEVAIRLSAARPDDIDGIADDLKGVPSAGTGSD